MTQTKQINTGDLIKFRAGKGKRYGFGLVIRLEREQHGKVNFNGFYYVRCDKYGCVNYWVDPSVSAANYVNHSNMLLGDEVSVVRHIELSNSYGMPSTGITAIDNYLALLDGRYNTFRDQAPQEMLDLFDRNQDRNYHSENALMVACWYQQWLLKNVAKLSGGLKAVQS